MWRNCFSPFSSGWWEKTWLRIKGGPRGRAGRAQLVGVPGIPGTVPTPWARDTGREHVTVQASSLFRYGKARQSGHGCHGRESFSSQLPGARGTARCGGRATQGSSRASGRQHRYKRRSLYCCFRGKEQVRQREQAWDWLLWVISGLWGTGAASGCLSD